MPTPEIRIDCPDWVDRIVDWRRLYPTDEDKMRLAIDVSRENVVAGTGGPFGAAIFESETGKLVAVGMNSVVRLQSSSLHGEMMAFLMAQARLGSFTLAAEGMPRHELATSCEPCAMCLGATLWSGVKRILWGAHRDDARRLNFEEGPVFPESHTYLEARGIEIVRGVLHAEANEVLELYRKSRGVIYNA